MRLARSAGGWGGKAVAPFNYRDKGSMAVIGRSAAVAMIGPLKLSGFPAWLAWLFIHLLYIVEFHSRRAHRLAMGVALFHRQPGGSDHHRSPGAPPTSRP